MAVPIHIPKLGMTMADAMITEWKAGEGEWLEKGSIALVIETEKITWEVEAVASGFLHIIVEKGVRAPVGATIGYLAETKEDLTAIQKEYPRGAPPDQKAPPLKRERPPRPNLPRRKFLLPQVRPPAGWGKNSESTWPR